MAGWEEEKKKKTFWEDKLPVTSGQSKTQGRKYISKRLIQGKCKSDKAEENQ